MARSVQIGQLASAMSAAVNDYAREKEQQANQAVAKVGKELAADLKAASPKSAHAGKHYASGWVAEAGKSIGEGASVKVRNKAKPALTHLLEHGHETRNGGFVPGVAHIAPAFERAVERLKEEMSQ